MKADSPPQPCADCQRPVQLTTFSWGRQWVHLGTWRPQCGPPAWAAAQGTVPVGAARAREAS